jgi:hypothetical protein
MAQIQSGNLTPFTSGQVLTAADLNSHVNSATLLPGAITDVTNITANTVASGDSILLYDLSATALREANISDVLGSDLPVTTSAITAGANSDILVTPNDATIVTGSTYTSADGLTVVVTTAAAHGLSVGQVLLISAAGAGYNGTFRLTVAAGSSFTYVMTTAATPGSGSLAYTKKATNRVSGNVVVNQNLYIDGNLGGNPTFEGNPTFQGNANFTGTLKINGNVGYLLTDIYEETIPPYAAGATGNYAAIWQSAPFTKPAGEIWIFELQYTFEWSTQHPYNNSNPFGIGFRYASETAFTGKYRAMERHGLQGVTSQINTNQVHTRQVTWIAQSGDVETSQRVACDVSILNITGLEVFPTICAFANVLPYYLPYEASVLRIYKYKTA